MMAEYIGVEKFIASSPLIVYHVCPVCISLWHNKDAGWFKESMAFITIRLFVSLLVINEPFLLTI